MTRTQGAWRVSSSILVLAWLLASSSPLAAEDYEAPPKFKAADLLPEEMLAGSGWSVRDEIRSDGFLNHYIIVTPDGEHEVAGSELFKIRLREVWAKSEMDEITRAGAFKDAAVEAAKSPFIFVKDLVVSPVSTVSGVVRGTGQFFSNIGHALFGSKSEQEEGIAGAALGTAVAKRAYAKKFKIDPYTEYMPVQERLADLAWASFAGGLTTGVAMGAVAGTGAVGTALEVTSFAADMGAQIYDLAPAQLRDMNREKMIEMGVSESVRDAFLDNEVYSPTRKTFIVGALERMENVPDREIYFDETLLAANDADAFLYQRAAEMMAAYHGKVEPVRRIVRLGVGAYMVTTTNNLVLVTPNDYLAWTQDLEKLAERSGLFLATDTLAVKSKELWLGGKVSDLARRNLEEAGWTVKAETGDQLRLD